MHYIVVFLSLVTVILVNSVAEGANEELTYLSEFGYLDSTKVDLEDQANRGSLTHSHEITKAIQEFQRYFGLPVTGVLDVETKEEMAAPRCGISDKGYEDGDVDEEELDELTAVGTRKWLHHDLTYRVTQYSERVDTTETDQAVKAAFDMWASATPLTFTRRDDGPVDIDIRFESGDHGCRKKFDGPGRVLAHAYYPRYINGKKTERAGDTHIDESERWTIDDRKGKNLRQVLTHEFGHALGLKHSDVLGTIMFPKYKGYNPSFSLHEEDVSRIQDLYGESVGLRQAAVNICDDFSADATFRTADGEIYLFKGEHYWKRGNGPFSSGLISERWPGLPANIDTAFSVNAGKTYFFKGRQFWLYVNYQLVEGYPKAIASGFPGIPDDLDVGIATRHELFFFKGSKYWKFDPYKKTPVSSLYRNGRSIEPFWGVPPPLDSAFYVNNDYTYFIKGSKYYRYNNATRQVDLHDIPLTQSLFKC